MLRRPVSGPSGERRPAEPALAGSGDPVSIGRGQSVAPGRRLFDRALVRCVSAGTPAAETASKAEAQSGPGAQVETEAEAEAGARVEVELRRGAPVYARSGAPVGMVAALLVSEPEGHATHLLLTPAPPTGKYRLVPCELVLRVEAGWVHLACSTEAITALEVFEAPPGTGPAHAR